MKRIILYSIGAVVILAAGIAHGVLTDRWYAEGLLQKVASRVAQLPMTVGDWTGEDLEVSQRQMDQTGAYGYLSRRYVHKTTGQAISVMLLCGKTGPLSVHAPTYCFTATGYEAVTTDERYAVASDRGRELGSFWRTDFMHAVAHDTTRTRLFWGWSDDGSTWKAPDHPRMAFAGKPYLYKLYVMRELTARDDREKSVDNDACVDFLRRLLPEARETLRSDAASEEV
jgi:hypothetical protein